MDIKYADLEKKHAEYPVSMFEINNEISKDNNLVRDLSILRLFYPTRLKWKVVRHRNV